MRARTWCGTGAAGLLTGALVVSLAGPVVAADTGHDFGRMGPANARTTSVSPSSGPDFEMPFPCGQSWTGSSRSGHSPSYYTIDFNAPDDLGKPVLATAPGIVIKAVTLTGSYGRYVVVDHGNGFTSLYGHLNKIATTVGTYLDQGTLIGYLGTSGNSTGPHLHFEERKDGAYFPPYFHRATFRIGSTATSANCADRPVSGDWNGDGVSEVGIFRTTPTRTEFWEKVGAANTRITWGIPGDEPLVGNWQGDRTSEIAARRLGTATFYLREPDGSMQTLTNQGYANDLPLSGDWDGNGITDLALYRPTTREFWLKSPQGHWTGVTWGATGEIPVSGDWNGDGRTDIGSWNSTTGVWTLRVPTGSTYTTHRSTYGTFGDLPVTGDWNGDGVTDLGIWRTSTGTFWERVPAAGGRSVHQTVAYGLRR